MNEEILRKIEGLQTVETVAEVLKIKKQSAINLLSKLKKQGYVTVSGGGEQKRLYKITMRKQHARDKGMFDILNKYSPMKLAPWYDHQVHGPYTVEDALIDAIETGSFRAVLASLRLFNHINDWPKLYNKAKKRNCWQKVGALHDVARIYFKVRKMPSKYSHFKSNGWLKLTQLKEKNFPEIANKWHVYIPFNEKDLRSVR